MRRTAGVLAVVVGLVPAGCGGEDDEPRRQPGPAAAGRTTPTSGAAPAKQVFVRKADALCAETSRRIAPISAAVKAKIAREDAAGVAGELRRSIPIAAKFLEGMRSLKPPKGDGPAFAAYLETVAAQKRRIPPLVEALEAEDISTIEVLAAELSRGNRRVRRLAQRYGFTRCGPDDLPTR